ncbi:gamma-mobile-trio protein GmtX [Pleionea litopenaei]|uniref:Gamma-mobile-trio protein GmtX n=1 Tax=Pleionea litopenaei TaxID=3070815 RepID=A0AA51RS99_9GAMM|nr:gamma-mobile-trio protein GmtX [Pleionea sp. HL-JVS1]WMS86691.1 gamma-mobile-trio protein GmtX [Pleionea sp. HL-JVS1]
MNPDKMLEKLKIGISAQKKKTLDAIFTVCKEQVDRGVSDFSIATIARLGYNRGVPKAQSIRNKTGDIYRALIASFEQANGRKNKHDVNRKEQSWIEEISNPKQRLLALVMASELKALKQKLREIVPPNQVIEVYDHKNSQVDSEHRLTSQERKALEYLKSDSFIKKWHFTKTEYGEVIDENNKVVFKPATIDALTKALQYL